MYSRIIATKQLNYSKGSTSILVISSASFLNVLLKRAFTQITDASFRLSVPRYIAYLKLNSRFYALNTHILIQKNSS